jgi:hypothetical protein
MHCTQFTREIGMLEGFRRMFEGDFVEPLRKVIEVHVPISSLRPGHTWRDALQSMGEDYRVLPTMECKGQNHYKVMCEYVGGGCF